MNEKAIKQNVIGRSLHSVVQYLSPFHKRRAAWLFVLSFISSLLEVFGLASLVPIVLLTSEPGGIFKNKWTQAFYSALNFNSEKLFLLALIGSFLIFFLLKTVFTILVNYRQARFTGDIGYDLIQKQVNKYLQLPYWKFNDIGSVKLMTSALDVPFLYTQNILRPAVALLSEGLIALMIILGILLYKPILLLALGLILGPICILTYRAIRQRVQHFSQRMHELHASSLELVSDLFIGFVELRLAARQDEFAQRLFVAQRESQDLDASNYLYGQLPAKTIELAAVLGVLTIFLYTILLGNGNSNLITLVGLFAAAAYRLMPSLNRIMTVIVQFRNHQFVIDEIEAYKDITQPALPITQTKRLVFANTLVLDNLTFTFPGGAKPALSNVNITVKKGEKIGFIGTSGSGKTTLMNLLLRFYVEQEGQILVDGIPLGMAELAAWHGIIGYVKQDTFLMRASIRDNITLGETKPDETRLKRSIEQASLKQFVDSLPEGEETYIGERGSKLSGGQRQRIGIARALYKQAEVLILDEATSALDNETEREVNEAINKLSQTDITILIVAHRLTTLRECDKVYELSEGKLIAEHQYEHLLKRIL